MRWAATEYDDGEKRCVSDNKLRAGYRRILGWGYIVATEIEKDVIHDGSVMKRSMI